MKADRQQPSPLLLRQPPREDQAQLRLRLDRQALARYGLNIRDVQDVIELAIGGRTVSTYFDGGRRFDITVRYVPEARADPTAIGDPVVPNQTIARARWWAHA